MKKIIIFFLCLCILCSCENKEEQTISEYYPTYNAIDMKPGTIFSNVAISLTDYNATYTTTSNYNGKTANVYEYDTFEIETYYDEKEIEKIYSIRITSEEQPTNEGIKIGDTIDGMLNTYGVNYTNPIENIYLYNLANTNISFTIENEQIIEIIYYLT